MTKDEALLRFFNSLRVAFKNATMYKMNHPAFVHCIKDLKGRAEDVFMLISPLSVGFTPRSLFADGRFWEGDKTFRELGMLFHLRKIKTLEIRPGITFDELMRFSTKVTLPLSEFVKLGGGGEILKKEKIMHISVEELDYKELLRGTGEEIKDVWPYLLQEAVDENDAEKIIDMAESFDRVVDKLNTAELVIDENMNSRFSRFFTYLKENDSRKYRACAKNLIKSFVTDKNVNPLAKLDNLKLLITDLKEEDLASTLWEEIISDQNFDSLSFSIFSRLLETDQHKRISRSLQQLFQTDNPLNRRPEIEEKVKALLSGTSGQFISETYRQTLSSLLKDIHFEKKIAFDHEQLALNYLYILLNVLERETDGGRMAAVTERILGMWEEISGRGDFEFLSSLQEVLLSKRSAYPNDPALQKIDDAVGECIERAVLDERDSPYFDQLISGLAESRLGLDLYLEKIVSEGRITPFILRAYYRFFKEKMEALTSRLKEKEQDRSFLDRIIAASKTIDSSLSLTILKAVYDVGDESVRGEVLRAMDCLSEIDKDFLFPILRSPKISLKSEALVILTGRDTTRKRALDRFLRFQSPYGILNKKLKAHIQIVESKGLREAAGHLERLGRRKSWWNRSLRQEARRVLEKWNEG